MPGSPQPISPAFTDRSGSISVPCRRPRSPFRSSVRSPPSCAPIASRGAKRRDDGAPVNFGEIAVGEAAGAILAHSVKLKDKVLRKGRVLGTEDVAALIASGTTTIIAARLTADEIGEDEAAALLARAASGANLSVATAFTVRANVFADARGLCVVDRARLDEFNLVDEAVTLATLVPFALVEPKQMVATIKIVPFGAPRAVVERCAAIAAQD